ncbi:MAG: DUF488 domain-containing protein [Oscillospiraceae bacterium]|nr:DUF488 domain-containing protein [Oscillospiraceae bacterium]
MNKIFTIGYSPFPLPSLIRILHDYEISVLIDVRSVPYSAHFPDYSLTPLKHRLHQEKIIYKNYAREFGARRDGLDEYTDGIVDFQKTAQSSEFRSGIDRVLKGMEMGYRFCLMCAEADPITCHRGILIAMEFARNGCEVIHILKNGIETQKEFEVRLMDKYFPMGNQISFLENSVTINDAYLLAGKEIGVKITKS